MSFIFQRSGCCVKTADPSTALLAVNLREAPLRMTLLL